MRSRLDRNVCGLGLVLIRKSYQQNGSENMSNQPLSVEQPEGLPLSQIIGLGVCAVGAF